jgi:hypothetical protein
VINLCGVIMTQNEYFSFSERQDQFDKALNDLIQNVWRVERGKLLPLENVMRYRHGTKWVTTASNVSQKEREMKVLETITELNWKDIREHNLEVLPFIVTNFVREMKESFQKIMHNTVSEVCETTGQTIDAMKYKSVADAYLESIKSVEFGVDREGRISIPQFHATPKTIEALKKDAESKGKAFEDEVQEVIREKSEKALEREKKRLARFKT